MRALLLDHARRYPLWELSDLYKLLHQAALGAEHALSNEAAVRDYLTRELAALEADATPDAPPLEPLLDPLTPDSTLVRVHLRPYIRLGLDPEALLQAFFRTGEAITPQPERLTEYAALAGQLAQEGNLPFDTEALAAFFAERQAQGFPAFHHSARYRALYRPAYRVVARALLPEGIPQESQERLSVW